MREPETCNLCGLWCCDHIKREPVKLKTTKSVRLIPPPPPRRRFTAVHWLCFLVVLGSFYMPFAEWAAIQRKEYERRQARVIEIERANREMNKQLDELQKARLEIIELEEHIREEERLRHKWNLK